MSTDKPEKVPSEEESKGRRAATDIEDLPEGVFDCTHLVPEATMSAIREMDEAIRRLTPEDEQGPEPLVAPKRGRARFHHTPLVDRRGIPGAQIVLERMDTTPLRQWVAVEIASYEAMPKQTVNNALYRLLGLGLVKMNPSAPPRWTLVLEDVPELPTKEHRERGKHERDAARV